MFLFQFLKRQSCHPSKSNSICQVQLTQAVLHQSLECGQRITKPKWHVFTFKESYVTHSESVYCFEASSMAICQNSAFKCKQEKYPAPPKPLRLLPVSVGVGKSLSWFSHSIYERINAEMHRPPSFLYTSITALHHGLWLWANHAPFPTFPSYEHGPCPP